jgi:hypothetical protein
VHTGALTGIPVLTDGHHHSFTQRLVQLLGGCFPERYIMGIFQLCLGPFYNIQAIYIHSAILHSKVVYHASAEKLRETEKYCMKRKIRHHLIQNIV